MVDYLSQLNEAQRQAVENFDGPALVIAGAGSGKTRVLTYRIAHLLACGKRPSSILSLTFTNKAAREMKERIANIVGEETARYLWMGTFHSVFAKILRMEADALGYTSNYTIYDSDDSKSLIKTIVKERHLDPQVYKPNDVLARISKAKNNLITPKAYESSPQLTEGDRKARRPEIASIYKTYAQRCYKADAMDFDDLLLNTNILFRDHPVILKKFQQKYQYILVDEYQDTNLSQYLILKKLAQKHQNLCVVGDDAQSIYAFRGAKIENILNFKNDYPKYKLYKLEQNYRSTQTIVEGANSLIAKNRKQIPKNVYTENESGRKIKILANLTDSEESYTVANLILEQHLREHSDFRDFAILYRTNAQSRSFEEAFRKRNIPYRIYGGLSFYQRKEIKDILAYCRLVVNHNDDQALKRIINYPRRGIGAGSIDKIEQKATEQDVSMWQIITQLDQYKLGLRYNIVEKILGFVNMIEDFAAKMNVLDAYLLVKEIAGTSGILKEFYADKSPESISRHENIQELLNSVKEFVEQRDLDPQQLTLDNYLQDVSLMTGDDKDQDENADKVKLMTIHAAKGLEFENVYIVGVEEDLFPSRFSVTSESALEEERRLFYVAITRAEKNLAVSFARTRYRWGELSSCMPSRFLKDVDPRYLDWPDENDMFDQSNHINNEYNNLNTFDDMATRTKTPKTNTIDPLPANKRLVRLKDSYEKNNKQSVSMTSGSISNGKKELAVGVQVEHKRFGYGKVTNLEGDPANLKATVEFDKFGSKQLLLKYAQLTIIG